MDNCLTDLISLTYTAFITARGVTENVLLAQELMNNYHRILGLARCTLILDTMKAYDFVKQ